MEPQVPFLEHHDYPGLRFYTNGSIWTSNSFKEDEFSFFSEGLDWFELKQKPDKDGYLRTKITGQNRTVHTVMCRVYHGEKPTEDQEVRHLDGDQTNNKPNNLKWGTKIENRHDQKLHDTEAIGERNGRAVITDKEIQVIIQNYSSGKYNQSELAEQYNTTQPCISRILSGKRRNSHAESKDPNRIPS